MSNVDDDIELKKILRTYHLYVGVKGAEENAVKAITTLIEQSERKARIDEWKLISEVQHSAGITAELYFGKERDERINQLTTKEDDDQPDKTEQDT